MKDILAEPHRQVVADLARSHALIAFDYDGTLAPIVDDPDMALMRHRTRDLLIDLAHIFPCAVISGRSQEDVNRRLRGIDVVGVIGNHGLEPWRRTELQAERVQQWLPALREGLNGLPGVTIENKFFSVAVHYRQSPAKGAARERTLEIAEGLSGLRIINGKDVVNLVPAGASNKGTALESLRERVGCVSSVYVGDDETDEDAFALEDSGRVLGIRVEPLESSRASFFIRDQESIDDLLRSLCDRRLEREGTDGRH
jgi:trehalose 6-phosphate phosphatase